MGVGSSPAMQALRRAQAAARYAHRTGCDIGEATGLLAEHAAGPAGGKQPGQAGAGDGLSRRQVLRGAAGAGLAAAVTADAIHSPAARAAVRRGPRVVIIQGRRSGNLHFAGEHTSLDFQGYMEGALRSGYRCAAEIGG